MKKLYVDNKLVALGDYNIKEVDEPEKYTVRLVHDYDYEPCNDSGVTFLSNHRGFRFDGEVTDEVLSKLGKEEGYYPVYMLDHSGYTISKYPFNDRWDSGLLGVAVAESDSDFDSFFEELKAAMEGEVYGFQVLNELGEIVDSCYGFYGKSMYDDMYCYISDCYGITREDLEKAAIFE